MNLEKQSNEVIFPHLFCIFHCLPSFPLIYLFHPEVETVGPSQPLLLRNPFQVKITCVFDV